MQASATAAPSAAAVRLMAFASGLVDPAPRDPTGASEFRQFGLLLRNPGAHLRRQRLEDGVVMQWLPEWIVVQRVPPLHQVVGCEGRRERSQGRLSIAGQQLHRCLGPEREDGLKAWNRCVDFGGQPIEQSFRAHRISPMPEAVARDTRPPENS